MSLAKTAHILLAALLAAAPAAAETARGAASPLDQIPSWQPIPGVTGPPTTDPGKPATDNADAAWAICEGGGAMTTRSWILRVDAVHGTGPARQIAAAVALLGAPPYRPGIRFAARQPDPSRKIVVVLAAVSTQDVIRPAGAAPTRTPTRRRVAAADNTPRVPVPAAPPRAPAGGAAYDTEQSPDVAVSKGDYLWVDGPCVGKFKDGPPVLGATRIVNLSAERKAIDALDKALREMPPGGQPSDSTKWKVAPRIRQGATASPTPR